MNGTTTKAAAAGGAISAKDLAKLSGERDRVLRDLATRTDERDKGAEALKAMMAERDQGNATIGELTKSLEAAKADLTAMRAERDTAVADLAKATKATDKAKADLKVAKAAAKPKSAKARAIGPVDGEQPRGEDLLTLIGAADTVELVFSDGKREITALAPQLIEGDAWYQAANGVRLRVPSLLVHGPGRDDRALHVAGYGLVLDGELTAYAPRIDVLTILPGSQHELNDDVIFG